MKEKEKVYYRQVAEKALEEYEVKVESLEYLCEETNVFFKVICEDGQKYALKIFQEASSKLEDNLAEIFFIDLVKANTDLQVPSVKHAKDGRGVVTIYDVHEKMKRIALYEWLNGQEIDENESLPMFEAIGEIAATLHVASKDVNYPQGICPKRWDKVFYYRGEEAVYHDEEYKEILWPECTEALDRIIPHLDHELAKLYVNQKTQLIHGDLNPYNILTDGKKLSVIDFEEAFDALPVHDVGVHLFYYLYDERFSFEEVYENFMKGYHKVLPNISFSRQTLDMLMTARRVNFMNYGLTILEDPKAYLEKNLPRIMTYMEKYHI